MPGWVDTFRRILGRPSARAGGPLPPPLPLRDRGLSFLGRYQQGQELPVTLQCVNAATGPSDPTELPRLEIYRDGATPTLIETVQLAADLRGVAVGVFRRGVYLGERYGTAGRYLLVAKYTDTDGTAHCEHGSFMLLPGGSDDGAVIAAKYVERPDASYLLYQTDAGRLIRGRNPR